ncbi:MAG: phosphatidate cytidylyltransferase [Kangiella sp.]|nr:phosphatidate cytidylyltransferase [Kangiella sp.]
MLKQRIITALVLLPLAMALLFYPGLEVFSLILIPIFVIIGWEWSRLLQTNMIIKSLFIAFVIASLCGTFYWLNQREFFDYPVIPTNWTEIHPFKLLIVSIMAWVVAFVLILLYPKVGRVWLRGPWVRALFGLVFLASAWLAVVLIRSTDIVQDHYYGGWLLLLMFVVIWGADVGAYAFGKTMGKRKLAPVVSPNKTWEGAMGGLITATVLSTIAAFFIGLSFSLAWFVLLALVLVVVSVIGDLFESMLKRQAGIKDSSQILPGHGGLLDRLDSTLSVAPFFIVALLIFKHGLSLNL